MLAGTLLSRGDLILIYSRVPNKLVFAVVTSPLPRPSPPFHTCACAYVWLYETHWCVRSSNALIMLSPSSPGLNTLSPSGDHPRSFCLFPLRTHRGDRYTKVLVARDAALFVPTIRERPDLRSLFPLSNRGIRAERKRQRAREAKSSPARAL